MQSLRTVESGVFSLSCIYVKDKEPFVKPRTNANLLGTVTRIVTDCQNMDLKSRNNAIGGIAVGDQVFDPGDNIGWSEP